MGVVLRFFFDFVDGDRATRDVDGHDLDGVEAVRAEMLRALPEILLCEPGDGDHRQIACSVRDGSGAVVCRATVTLEIRLLPNV